ncbi:MAG: DUF3783 domain-containing protein [Eggerthellaceae bacterium]|nr:DUF3783 domain-containing protein [Eggerthellaceae bacterium]
MAKGKKGAKKQVAGPMAALYRLDAGTPRGDAVRAVLAAQGIRMKTVTEERLGDPVGAIAGLVGFRPTRTPYVGQVPESEFMLLCHVPNALMNQLLAAMREADCSVGCKAQLTQHNRLWPFATLVHEVSREHEMMMSSDGES